MPPDFPGGFRLVTLCGSVRPMFDGVDDYEERLIEALQLRGVDVRPVDLGSWGVSQIGRLVRAVMAARPDAILMQYPTGSFGHSLGPHIFSILQSVAPLIVTLHEFTAAHILRRLSIGALLLRTTIVVAIADREAQSLRRWYPWLTRRRIRVIPIGANISPREWAPATSPEVVYFGQIRPNKGLEAFLACHDRLTARNPRPKFTIIGSPVSRFTAYFDSTVADIRRRDISLFTELDKEAVSDRLATSWVALLPFPDGASFRRGSLLAAAVCGLPIVTRRGPDTPSNLNTLLAPVSTVDEMTARVAHYLDDPAARQAAHQQSCTIAKMADWSTIADSYIDAFRNLSHIRRS